MDYLTIFGMLLAVVAILVGQSLDGGHITSLLNGPALMIVLGGSVGAIMVQAPYREFKHALSLVLWILFPKNQQENTLIKKLVLWSDIARKEGLLGLETASESEKDVYARKCLDLLVEGREPNTIRAILEVEIDAKQDYDLTAARLYEAMGGYAPTIGILGAVMGLIHVMENLTDPSKLGAGIATAFVATIYGVGIANLLLLPIANKLKSIISHQTKVREMMMEGVVAIAEGDSPRNIEVKMKSFFPHLKFDAVKKNKKK